MPKSAVVSLVAAALIAACTPQVQRGAPGVASRGTPLGEIGRIRDWRADGTTGVYVESDSRRWYHATFVSPCSLLSSAGHIDFRTAPPFPIDTFDAIQIRDVVCYFKSLEEVPGPADTAAPKPAKNS